MYIINISRAVQQTSQLYQYHWTSHSLNMVLVPVGHTGGYPALQPGLEKIWVFLEKDFRF